MPSSARPAGTLTARIWPHAVISGILQPSGARLRDYRDEHSPAAAFLRGTPRGTTSAPRPARVTQLRTGPHPAGSRSASPSAPLPQRRREGRFCRSLSCLPRPALSGEAALPSPSRAARRHQALKPRRLRGLGCHGGEEEERGRGQGGRGLPAAQEGARAAGRGCCSAAGGDGGPAGPRLLRAQWRRPGPARAGRARRDPVRNSGGRSRAAAPAVTAACIRAPPEPRFARRPPGRWLSSGRRLPPSCTARWECCSCCACPSSPRWGRSSGRAGLAQSGFSNRVCASTFLLQTWSFGESRDGCELRNAAWDLNCHGVPGTGACFKELYGVVLHAFNLPVQQLGFPQRALLTLLHWEGFVPSALWEQPAWRRAAGEPLLHVLIRAVRCTVGAEAHWAPGARQQQPLFELLEACLKARMLKV